MLSVVGVRLRYGLGKQPEAARLDRQPAVEHTQHSVGRQLPSLDAQPARKARRDGDVQGHTLRTDGHAAALL